MKSKLKIQFSDFWSDFNPNENLFTDLLSHRYDIELSENPDILIYSVYDFNHLKYNCRKIFYTAENVRPNFAECDYAITFDYDTYNEKNLRMPYYRWRGDLKKLCEPKDPIQIAQQKSKFCCMVVSNDACKERNQFFHLLSQYKQVDSGGRYLNNVGGPVANKMEFIKDYKFVLAFENSSFPGYTTEKIIEPMLANSIPVYWGNPLIGNDFNSKSIINIHDYPSFEAAIEEIIRIDQNDELYNNYIKEPYFENDQFPTSLEFSSIEQKLYDMTEALLVQIPISKKVLYKPAAIMNKYRRKLLSRIHKRPHFYF